MVLQESATKITWRDSLHRRESAISHGSRRPQTETAGAHQREKPVVFEAERHKAKKEKRRQQKVRAASLPPSFQTFVCPKCGRGCTSRIRIYSHQRACKNWPSTFPTILVCEEWAIIIIMKNTSCNQMGQMTSFWMLESDSNYLASTSQHGTHGGGRTKACGTVPMEGRAYCLVWMMMVSVIEVIHHCFSLLFLLAESWLSRLQISLESWASQQVWESQ